MNTEGLSSPRTRCRSASLQTPFSILPFIPTDLKVRGYFAFGIPSLQTLFSTLPFISTGSRTRGYSPFGFASLQTLFLCSVMLKFAVKREQSQACLGLSYCHAELVLASHCEPFLHFLRGQILKRVQDDSGKFTTHNSPLIAQPPTTMYRPLPVLRHPR